MRLSIALTAVFSAIAVVASPTKRDRYVSLNEMSQYDCVKSCVSAYMDIESYTQHKYCEGEAPGIRHTNKKKVIPCIADTCSPSDREAIKYESRVWFCNFCGWPPSDADFEC